MNKHAYLIIAHDKYEQLGILISFLDDYRNDIYVHIDRKSPPPPKFVVNKSKIHIYHDNNCFDVRWGDISQIQCELFLYEKALFSDEKYSYYHLLSGYCLPIKSQDYIHTFLNKHAGTNFIGFGQYGAESYIKRISYRHYFTRMHRERNRIKWLFYEVLRPLVEFPINLFYPIKLDQSIEYKKGANWCSLTNEFVSYLVSKKDYILKHYERSLCADEVYKQTLIWNSSFKDTIYDSTDEFNGCLRLIDWERGFPYIWGKDELLDTQIIVESSCLFARKMDILLYPSMLELLKKIILDCKA